MRIMTANIWGDYFENPVSVREKDIMTVFGKYSPDVILSKEHTDLAREVAAKGMVLLKNENNTLPVAKGRKIVIGPC